jgi:hypothetical protein
VGATFLKPGASERILEGLDALVRIVGAHGLPNGLCAKIADIQSLTLTNAQLMGGYRIH